jgi:hypothetical protein
MNRTALKSYAPKARLDFIRAITDRAAFFGLTPERTEAMQETGDVVLIGGRAFPKVVAGQRRSLEARVKDHGFAQVMEAMAYTWFNRFVALRYMELHGYLEHGYRVLSHPEGKPTPEILEHAEHVTLPGLDPQKVIELKLDGGQDAVLYRLLLVAQCNALHEAMPFLFEKIADETELLLPDNLLHSDSLIRKLVNEIEEGDWQQVEIIGWLYQFYISDKKDEVIGKVVKSEDIPAATQLFTPNWIVKYLVQNTLGRQWLATYPDSPLRQQMEYYIAPAAQTADVQAQLAAITPQSLDPETLTLLDPASGSGHILVEAYDLFKAIYQERGYRSKDIPRLILEKNLFGLEIDDRAAQLAAFALLMKARADDRRIFADHVQPNVIAIQESKGLEHLLRPDPAAAKGAGELPFADSDLFPQTEKQLTLTKPNQESPLAAVEPCLRELINLFEHGKTFGSLIRVPPELAAQLPAARQSIVAMITTGQLWEHRAAALLLPLVKQAELLARSYDAVVANPPYIGPKGLNSQLKELGKQYFFGLPDLFAMFALRCLDLQKANRCLGLMTPMSWMFIVSFRKLRQSLFSNNCISTLVRPEFNAFWAQAHVPICAYTLLKGQKRFAGTYIDLESFMGAELQPIKLLEAIADPNCSYRFNADSSQFHKIEDSPVVYWLSQRWLDVFGNFPQLKESADVCVGLQTGDNTKFLRQWYEVSTANQNHSSLSCVEAKSSGKKWFPYNKGGNFRKWWGNCDAVVLWEEDGHAIKNFKDDDGGLRSRPQNTEYFFRPSVTWSFVSSANFGVRRSDGGFVFDVGGSSLFPHDGELNTYVGFLCTKLAFKLMRILNPTVNFQVGNVASLPFPKTILTPFKGRISAIAEEAVEISRWDWNVYETSRGFTQHSCLCQPIHAAKVESSFHLWQEFLNSRVRKMQELETENNEIFIHAYGLDGEISPEVPESQITLARADRERDMQRLLSYAIGCMVGRYSLDKPGLVYAHSRNEGFDASQYQTFPADADGIIPITELAWFPDDATERFVEFIGKAWPAEHLEENLKFIADSLGANRDEHPRDTIRRYLSQNFYKDHLQTYKRRPIYWLFSSGKQKAFSCLVYLHRYHEGTLARMRTEYVIPLQGKLSQRIEQLAGDITAATSTSHRRKLEKERETLVKQRTELAAFDEKLRHYADQRIALDLDDGVKVNYSKFGDLLAEVKAVTGGVEE